MIPLLVRALLVVSIALISACNSVPVVPPTELSSINVEARMQRLWTRKLENSARGRFQPLALNGVVYAASRTGQVIAVDQASGQRKWIKQLDTTLGSGVGGSDNQLYVSDKDGLIIALSTVDGEELWELPASSEVLAPVSAGFGAVIVRSADGRVLSIDPVSGEERWSVTYAPPALTVNGYSQPLLVDGGALVGLEDGRLIALGTDAGNVLWESVVSVPSGRSEVERLADLDGRLSADNEAIYAVNYQGRLARIEPAKGQILWSVPISSTAGLALSESAVFVVADDDELHAFDKVSGQSLWTQAALKNRRLSAPQVIGDNLVLVGDLEGYLHIINTDDGRLVGRTRVGKRRIFPHITTVDDTVFVQSADGTVAALRPQL